MEPINWSPEYAVGIAEVDAQHHALLDMINALSAVIGTAQEVDTTREMLGRLSDYTHFHFALEERLMGETNIDPNFLTRHRGEHAYFIGVLKDFTADFVRGKGRISTSLLEYLLHWLLHHIVVTDREMAKHLHSGAQYIYSKKAESHADTIATGFNASELHMLKDLKEANAELEQQLQARTSELETVRARLEDALQQLSKIK